jgi:hypothetical protein
VSRQKDPQSRPFTLYLRDSETGERGTFVLDWYGDEDGGYEGIRFWLQDGNGGCDCNRSNWLNGSDLPCGGGMRNRIVIDKAQNEHGTLIYRDKEDGA